MKSYDVTIVGAGAAGLAAAVAFCRRCEGRALLIDVNDEAGRKILATGNGRCNLSHVAAPGWEKTKEFFDSLGVLLRTDEAGRAYPLSRRADAVRRALVNECKRLGCEFLLRTRVLSVSRGDEDDFVVEAESAAPRARKSKRNDGSDIGAERVSFRAKQVVVATGGKARPEYGNRGDGYALARAFGVEVNPIRPTLVPFLYADDVRGELAALAGVRAAADVKLLESGVAGFAEAGASPDATKKTRAERAVDGVATEASGEVQFTEYGLSGICIFDLSRCYEGQAASVSVDLAPGLTKEEIAELIAARRAAGLEGIVHPKIAAYIAGKMRSSAFAAASADEALSDREGADGAPSDATYAGRAAALIKSFVVPVKGTKGWKDAQITAGGVALSEVSEKYFESKDVPGLYFAGEVLDYDGPSGGYNLDYAWNTGLKAGRAAGAYCASYLPTE
ncbi:MAG: NAD(P)/FAD-dependent oxidoreductase [Clostridiales Family XIII bacterium]|jgi:predicted flavoprotein YhiN|nr:NAD(P)/FAD-dependent oxidoreductase [Clostridiales Family XIII bacterium]